MMKKFTKLFLIITLGSLLAGVILLGAGYATGGIPAIQKITEPPQKSETVSDLTNIDIETNRSIHIKAGNVDKPMITYYNNSKFRPDLVLSTKNKTLSIQEKPQGTRVIGAIEFFGYLLNESYRTGRSINANEVEITLPKNTGIQQITGAAFGGLTISNLTVEKIENSFNLTLNNATIQSGKIAGITYADSSKLSKLEISGGQIDISNSSLEDTKITGQGYLNINNSTVKNSSFSSGESEEEINDTSIDADSYDQNGYYIPSQQVTLDNVKLLGENRFMASHLELTAKLAPGSQDKTSLDIQTHSKALKLKGTFANLPVKEENDKSTVTHTAKDATGKLIIKSNQGSILLK